MFKLIGVQNCVSALTEVPGVWLSEALRGRIILREIQGSERTVGATSAFDCDWAIPRPHYIDPLNSRTNLQHHTRRALKRVNRKYAEGEQDLQNR